jgi:hypothetical protein
MMSQNIMAAGVCGKAVHLIVERKQREGKIRDQA